MTPQARCVLPVGMTLWYVGNRFHGASAMAHQAIVAAREIVRHRHGAHNLSHCHRNYSTQQKNRSHRCNETSFVHPFCSLFISLFYP